MRLRPSLPAFVRRLGLSASGVALVAVAGLLAAGCGGGSSGSSEAPADQPATDGGRDRWWRRDDLGRAGHARVRHDGR